MTSTYKLTYFDAPAAAEPIRYLFHYGGIKFEDYRLPRDQWPALKSKMPFGQVPVLEYNGKIVNQTKAISRYVAKLANLVGKDDWEDLEIDAMVDTFDDLKLHIVRYVHEQNQAVKAELKEKLDKETIPFYMSRIDAITKKNGGYTVGGNLTWADIYIVSLLDLFSLRLKKDDIMDSYPNLKKLQENVTSIENIKKYLSNRPKVVM